MHVSVIRLGDGTALVCNKQGRIVGSRIIQEPCLARPGAPFGRQMPVCEENAIVLGQHYPLSWENVGDGPDGLRDATVLLPHTPR